MYNSINKKLKTKNTISDFYFCILNTLNHEQHAGVSDTNFLSHIIMKLMNPMFINYIVKHCMARDVFVNDVYRSSNL